MKNQTNKRLRRLISGKPSYAEFKENLANAGPAPISVADFDKKTKFLENRKISLERKK